MSCCSGLLDQDSLVLVFALRVDVLRARGLASIRVAVPSIGPFSTRLACWRAASHSKPAPAIAAVASTGLRRTNLLATRPPVRIAPSAAPVSTHCMARPGTALRRPLPISPINSIARSCAWSSLLMVVPFKSAESFEIMRQVCAGMRLGDVSVATCDSGSSRFCAMRGSRIPGILRPRMTRVASFHFLLHFGVRTRPEPCQVLGDLKRPARRR